MSALVVTITTQQPLLASAIEGDPNSGETFPYIPGSVLRGALIARYNQPINLADATVKSLFFSNDVRFLHAYPLLEHNQRAIPLPHLLTVDTVHSHQQLPWCGQLGVLLIHIHSESVEDT